MSFVTRAFHRSVTLRGMTADRMPEWLEPMAATLTQERFTGGDWLFERKFDGIRLLAYKRNDTVRLFSRNRLPQHLPEVAAAVADLPVDEVILDGEVTWDGRSGYHVFDILWIDGTSVTAQPLEDRRALLEKLPFKTPMRRVELLEDEEPVGARPQRGMGRRDRETARLAVRASAVEALAQDEMRGVAGARRRRLYGSAGCARRAWGAARGLLRKSPPSRGSGVAGDFVFAGKIGTGFDTKLLLDLRRRLDAIELPASPFTKATGLPRLRAHWVRPEIVVQVAFIEWTVHGKLRHPRLLGVRFDKDARDVTREQP